MMVLFLRFVFSRNVDRPHFGRHPPLCCSRLSFLVSRLSFLVSRLSFSSLVSLSRLSSLVSLVSSLFSHTISLQRFFFFFFFCSSKTGFLKEEKKRGVF